MLKIIKDGGTLDFKAPTSNLNPERYSNAVKGTEKALGSTTLDCNELPHDIDIQLESRNKLIQNNPLSVGLNTGITVDYDASTNIFTLNGKITAYSLNTVKEYFIDLCNGFDMPDAPAHISYEYVGGTIKNGYWGITQTSLLFRITNENYASLYNTTLGLSVSKYNRNASLTYTSFDTPANYTGKGNLVLYCSYYSRDIEFVNWQFKLSYQEALGDTTITTPITDFTNYPIAIGDKTYYADAEGKATVRSAPNTVVSVGNDVVVNATYNKCVNKALSEVDEVFVGTYNITPFKEYVEAWLSGKAVFCKGGSFIFPLYKYESKKITFKTGSAENVITVAVNNDNSYSQSTKRVADEGLTALEDRVRALEIKIDNADKETLTFTVGNDTYEFYEGMTWADWIVSDFNPDLEIYNEYEEDYVYTGKEFILRSSDIVTQVQSWDMGDGEQPYTWTWLVSEENAELQDAWDSDYWEKANNKIQATHYYVYCDD